VTESDDTLPNPESAWRRLSSLPELSDGFLETHLSAWPELQSRPWEVLSGGLRSLNLRSDDVVVRIALAPEHDIHKEAALLGLLGRSVRVPKMLAVSDRALLLEYLPVRELPATAEAGFSVGSTAASIHEHRFPEAGFLNADLEVAVSFESIASALTQWVEKRPKTTGSPLDPVCARALPLWRQSASRLEAVSTSPVLVHSDFKVANVKWSPAEECAVVFDWEFAWAGPNLFDLGQMFRWNPPEPFVRGFEAGYRSRGGTLSDNWRRDAELYALLNLVDFLHRGGSNEIRDRDVRTRIAQTLERHRP